MTEGDARCHDGAPAGWLIVAGTGTVQMSRANPIVARVIERACAEVLLPETGAGTLAWQWTSDGAL